MHLFYTPGIKAGIYQLNEEESKHCSKVLRLGVGDEVHLTDGKGSLFKTKVVEIQPKKTIVQVVDIIKDYEKRKFHLHIAIAPTKNIDRFEWFLEKATEIGIDEITPLLCERSERKVIKEERLEKIIISALKQSVKAYLPKLNPLTSFNHFVSNPFNGQPFIAHCMDTSKVSLKTSYISGSNALVLIGPEGDFSPEEAEIARKHNYTEVSLGCSRLRTETAGVVACHTINLSNPV